MQINLEPLRIDFFKSIILNSKVFENNLRWLLEQRQVKNYLTVFEIKLILKLPPFFTHCEGEGKRR